MSQPTPYTPTTDFSQQEANNASGRSTVNTAALDAEFAAIDTTLDQTLANIQLLQRDDGRLMDVSVEMHTLSPEVLNLMGGFNLRGAWLSNTDYAVNDLVSSGSYTYVCSVAHNSGPTFSETNWLKFGFAGSNDAAQAAAAAAVSANEAHISELAAAASASSASGFATTATTQAGLASSSATAADASAYAALISETNSANSASAAASSASSISVPGGMAIVLKDSAGVSYVEGAAGTTAQRPGSPVVGHTRFNTTINADETWSGSAWLPAGNVTQTGAETLTNKTMAAATNTVEARSAPAASYFSNRNKIINGGFAVNQRVYASGAAVGTNLYGHDRWKMAASADTYTFSTTNNKTTVTIPAGKVLRHVIEGINLTTDTYVLSWGGTAQGKVGAGALSASGVTSAITGGTNTTIEFGPGTVENVQFEVGTIPTPFEVQTFDAELAACKRYWESSYSVGVAVAAASTLGAPRCVSVGTGVNGAAISVRFTVPKRSIPTFHSYSPINGVIDQITDSNTTNRNASLFDIGTTGAVIANAVSTTASATHTAHWVADAEL